jgi:hypothetical protein
MLPCAFFADPRLSVPSVHFRPFSHAAEHTYRNVSILLPYFYLFLSMPIIIYDQHVCLCLQPFYPSIFMPFSLTTFLFFFLPYFFRCIRKKLGQGKWMKNRLDLIRKKKHKISFLVRCSCVVPYARCWWFSICRMRNIGTD